MISCYISQSLKNHLLFLFLLPLSTQSTGKSGGFCLKNIIDPVSYSHSLLVHGASKDGDLFLGGFVILLTVLPVSILAFQQSLLHPEEWRITLIMKNPNPLSRPVKLYIIQPVYISAFICIIHFLHFTYITPYHLSILGYT